VRTGECDRLLFGPIAVALRDGPHEAASVREVARLLSKLMLGHDRTSQSTDLLLQLRYTLADGLRSFLHPGDGRVVPEERAPFEREVHPHTAARGIGAQSQILGQVFRLPMPSATADGTFPLEAESSPSAPATPVRSVDVVTPLTPQGSRGVHGPY
jgi:hypothetical protein